MKRAFHLLKSVLLVLGLPCLVFAQQAQNAAPAAQNAPAVAQVAAQVGQAPSTLSPIQDLTNTQKEAEMSPISVLYGIKQVDLTLPADIALFLDKSLKPGQRYRYSMKKLEGKIAYIKKYGKFSKKLKQELISIIEIFSQHNQYPDNALIITVLNEPKTEAPAPVQAVPQPKS